MHHLEEFKQIKKENPLYSLIAIEMMHGKMKNPIHDIQKGKVSKDGVLKLLNMSYQAGMVEQSYYRSFLGKLQNISINP